MIVLDALEELERKATKGPWIDNTDVSDPKDVARAVWNAEEFIQGAEYICGAAIDDLAQFNGPPERVHANMCLIAAARNNLTALVAVARAAWTVLEATEASDDADAVNRLDLRRLAAEEATALRDLRAALAPLVEAQAPAAVASGADA